MRKLGESYAETIALHDSGKVPEDCFMEITRVYSELSKPENLQDEETAESFPFERYDNYLGGAFYLVESLEDLDEIDTAEMRENLKEKRGWYTLAEISSSFDIAEKLKGNQDFIQICMITNNAGGNIYFIPKEYQTENVINSLQDTDKAWNGNNGNHTT